MGGASKDLVEFIDDIPDDKLTRFPSTPGTIYCDTEFRLDMQGMTSDGRYNLQVQANKGAKRKATRALAPQTVAGPVCATGDETAQEIKISNCNCHAIATCANLPEKCPRTLATRYSVSTPLDTTMPRKTQIRSRCAGALAQQASEAGTQQPPSYSSQFAVEARVESLSREQMKRQNKLLTKLDGLTDRSGSYVIRRGGG